MLKGNLFPEGRYEICGVFDASVDRDKESKPIIDNIIAKWR
jgi:hypothetical protein